MFIRHHFAAGLVAALASVAFPASAATLFYSTLSGAQEVPPSGSTGTGEARYEIRDNGLDGLSLAFEALFDLTFDFGLTGSIGTQVVTGLHIHAAPRGTNGSIVFGILGPSNDDDFDTALTLLADGSTRVTSEWDATENFGTGDTFADMASDFLAVAPGEDAPFYLNLHTLSFPAGEIRGQIVADPSPVPLPAGLPLLATAILLIGLCRRSHQNGRARSLG